MEPAVVIQVLVLGLAAGVVGGLAGIGGSIIMLPGLALLMPRGHDHHVSIAAAMIVNVLVAASATTQHKRAKAVRGDLVKPLLPAMIVSIMLGVLVSGAFDGGVPKLALAIFLGSYAVVNLVVAVRGKPEPPEESARPSPLRLIAIGTVTGGVAGFLGLGGGIILIPMLQLIAKVKLREAIAASAAVMAVSSVLGAGTKLTTVILQGSDWRLALWLSLVMGVAAVAGARLGARLTHRIKLPWLRLALSVVLALAAARMAWAEMAGEEPAAPDEQREPAERSSSGTPGASGTPTPPNGPGGTE